MAQPTGVDDHDLLKIKALIRWFRNQGGQISPKITIGYPASGGPVRGVVVASDCQIAAGKSFTNPSRLDSFQLFRSIIFAVPNAAGEEFLSYLRNSPLLVTASSALSDPGFTICRYTAIKLTLKLSDIDDIRASKHRAVEQFTQLHGKVLLPRSIMGIYLVLSKRYPFTSRAGLYVSCLPEEAPDLPHFWLSDEIDWMPGAIAEEVHSRKKLVDEQFDFSRSLLPLCSKNGAQGLPLTRSEFEWAWSHIHSRAQATTSPESLLGLYCLEPPHFAAEPLELVPLADMLNHRFKKLQGASSADSSSTDSIGSKEKTVYTALRELRAGDELTWEYASDLPPVASILGYGFWPEAGGVAHRWVARVDDLIKNSLDNLSRTREMIALDARKRALFTDMGVLGQDGPNMACMKLNADRDPQPIMSYARILFAADESEMCGVESSWAFWKRSGGNGLATNFVGPLSPSTESKVRKFVITYLQQEKRQQLRLSVLNEFEKNSCSEQAKRQKRFEMARKLNLHFSSAIDYAVKFCEECRPHTITFSLPGKEDMKVCIGVPKASSPA